MTGMRRGELQLTLEVLHAVGKNGVASASRINTDLDKSMSWPTFRRRLNRLYTCGLIYQEKLDRCGKHRKLRVSITPEGKEAIKDYLRLLQRLTPNDEDEPSVYRKWN